MNADAMEPKGMRLELEQLTKVHPGKRRVIAVDSVDLTVEPGELLVLLGPSGCGKSSLLELLAGLETPTSGEIRCDGRPVAAPARGLFAGPKERNVAMVFQSYALYPHLSVGENIAFPLRVAGGSPGGIAAAVREAAAAVELESLLDARPAELSGGQRQRVAIARAIVRRPSLFLMDEPLSNLDARLRSAMRGRIKSLQRSLGVTMVYVTHDQQEAMALGDRVAVMRSGRIEQVGAPAELYGNPVSAFVARFTGSPPMNLLRLRKSDADGALRFEPPAEAWSLPVPAGHAGAVPAGDTVLFGFRPEHASLLPAATDRGFPARVEASEGWGREYLVHLVAGRARLGVLAGGEPPAAGTEVRVELDSDRARLFADDGGE